MIMEVIPIFEPLSHHSNASLSIISSLLTPGLTVSQTHATIVMGVISAFVLIWLLSGVFWWTLFSSGFMVVVHAGLRDASMHQDGDDQVIMVGEVAEAGEQSAFLGDPQV